MKTVLFVILTIAVVFTATAGETNGLPERQISAEKIHDILATDMQNDALGAIVLLTALRNSKTNEVLEVLELQIDTAVTAAWHEVQKGTKKQKEKATEFLEQVKEYRNKHPRKQEAKLDDGSLQEQFEATAKNANEIIKQTNTASNKVQQVIVAAPSPEGTRVVTPSTYKGMSYGSFVTDAQLQSTPNLHSDRDPPLSLMKAKAIAKSTLDELIPAKEERQKWTLANIMLAPLSADPLNEPKGYYVVTWRGPSIQVRDDEASKKSERLTIYRDTHDEFRLIVLMDGKCVQPMQMTSNKEPEATQ